MIVKLLLACHGEFHNEANRKILSWEYNIPAFQHLQYLEDTCFPPEDCSETLELSPYINLFHLPVELNVWEAALDPNKYSNSFIIFFSKI